jgi:hypothetical protein
MKKVVRLTESDLARIVKRVIQEQSQGGPSPQRRAYFDNLAKQIASTIVGKKYFFGDIGVLDGSSIIVKKYVDRNYAIDLPGEPVKELSLFFDVRRVEEDLFPGEKPNTRVWNGMLEVTASFVNGKISKNPIVNLYPNFNGNVDFAKEMKANPSWTWDKVGGAALWSKAVSVPNK